ncbi:MAG: hypothetical protein A2X56_13145 [Nitrospirae bacterium GWC2_57_13]|nr:MAG: hypothetical protein A2X56_13145 [Nitrospirae bacterium GWC2_57_13]
MRAFLRIARFVSAITLFFFCWTYMPLYSIAAYAAEKKQVRNADPSRSPLGKGGGRGVAETAGDRFEKAIETIREKVGKAEEKAGRGEDAAGEIEAVTKQRLEIETLDSELRKEFSETEKKLKDTKLPQEILDRHYKFVKHYEDNLAELKKNLSEVEQYTADSKQGISKQQRVYSKQGKDALKRAKAHLDKTKAPSKHVPLDPNNLPFRSVKGKEREPRLKKEEFEKDFPPQRPQSSPRTAKLSDTDPHGYARILATSEFNSALRTHNSELLSAASPLTPDPSRILLAYNDIASDVPFQLPRPSEERAEVRGGSSLAPSPILPVTAFSVLSESSVAHDLTPNFELSTLNLAAATAADLPTAADLSQTPEVQFTPEIQAKALELGNNPVKIYEWVRNNIEFVPTYGSIQGADMCLQAQQCNAFDTASLLIALLRASNIPARYVYGTIEVPIEKVLNWAGGFTDPMAAASLMASGGIPVKPYIVGSKIAKVQMEHTWVETYIPYGNYRGAIMDQSIKTWIPMDGSFKEYVYAAGFDITPTVSFSQNDYLSQVQSQNPVHYYQSQIQEYLDANMPETSIIDVKGYREIKQERYPFLSSTLPYKTIVRGGVFASVPANTQAKAVFSLPGASLAFTMPEIAGKRITLSYIPATSSDEALISNYGGYIYGVPAYLLNLKPVLKIDGIIKLSGDAAMMGAEQALMLQLSQPKGLSETVQKKLIAGAYYAIGLDLQGINENVLGKRNYTLTTNVLSETAGTLGNDDLIGELLYLRAVTYFLANDKIYRSGAKLFNTVVTRTLSEGITSFTLSVSHLFLIPRTATPSGINMDVAMDRVIAVAKDGNVAKEKAYMDIAGLVSSYHEHDIFERIDGFSSVSAVRAIQVAMANGTPIHYINSSNIGQTLPLLQVASEIKTEIQNAVNAGKEVTIPQANVQINDWNGVGYFIKDVTGSGAYMISGGLAGSDSTSQNDGMQIVQLHKEPLGWVKDSIDPQTRRTIITAAELEIGELIVKEAEDFKGYKYETIGQCVGLVRKAYKAAGICLDEWAGCGENLMKKNGIPYADGKNGVYYFYEIAKKLKINESIRTTDDKLIIGDMVFWDNTLDYNCNCEKDDDLTHVGIVVKVNIDGKGTLNFIHAGGKGVVSDNPMNVTNDYKSSKSPYNTPLRTLDKPSCCTCRGVEKCSGTSGCKEGKKPYTCTEEQWDSVPKSSGQLFIGFGTIRNPK